MKNKKLLEHRKLLMVLPVIAFPFLTLMFWALGGASANGQENDEQLVTGVNATLPDADLDDTGLDKMAYYDKAMRDSVRSGLHDGYVDLLKESEPEVLQSKQQFPIVSNGHAYSGYGNQISNTSSREKQIQQRLDLLNQTLAEERPGVSYGDQQLKGKQYVPVAGDLDRLEQMMQQMSQPVDDPEMQQLDGMLNKILDIQNPERVQEELRKRSAEKRGQVFAVSTATPNNIISTMEMQRDTHYKQLPGNGFYSINEPALQDTQNAIRAVVHETQTVTSGAAIRLRLVNDIYVNGILIPSNTFLMGTVSLNGERLMVQINSVRYRNSIFPVSLTAFDLDGVEGVHVPGAIARDVAKKSTDQGLQGMGIGTMSPSLGVQAASVGIEAAKGFLSKKVKLIRVNVKAGYQVLLRDEQQKQ